MDLRAIADGIGYPAAGIGILIESSGIPFPGETMLLAVAALAAQGGLDIRIVIASAAAGAIIGANFGYGAGYFGGRPLLERFGRVLHVRASHVSQAEMFFARWGGWAVFAGRFVSVIRAWISFLAGMSRMPFRVFSLVTAAGAVLWAILIGTLGYYLGHNWGALERLIRGLGWAGLGLAIVVVAGILLARRRRSRT
ncbi:MAG: DedA family protein [Candidatus Dormibacteraceae bacterium]